MSAKSPINLYKGRYDIMAKVGLKDTLALLAKGYSKKDIDELAAIDEQTAEEQKTEETAKNEKQETEEKKDDTEILLKQLQEKEEELEKLRKENTEAQNKVTKLQQDNIHENSAPMAEEAKKAQQDSLNSLVRSFM